MTPAAGGHACAAGARRPVPACPGCRCSSPPPLFESALAVVATWSSWLQFYGVCTVAVRNLVESSRKIKEYVALSRPGGCGLCETEFMRVAARKTVRDEVPAGPPYLGDRDIDILLLLARGLSDKRMGSALGLSPATISTYVRDLLGKFGAANRAELVARAFVAEILVAVGHDEPPVWSGTRNFDVSW